MAKNHRNSYFYNLKKKFCFWQKKKKISHKNFVITGYIRSFVNNDFIQPTGIPKWLFEISCVF